MRVRVLAIEFGIFIGDNFQPVRIIFFLFFQFGEFVGLPVFEELCGG
jgi:hypothetical protein